MAKRVMAKVKLQVPGGQATPAPPVGPALGQHQVNIGEFVSRFNAQTKEANGMIIPVEIAIYQDRSFDFITKSPPAAVLLKKMATNTEGGEGIAKGKWAGNHRTLYLTTSPLSRFSIKRAVKGPLQPVSSCLPSNMFKKSAMH